MLSFDKLARHEAENIEGGNHAERADACRCGGVIFAGGLVDRARGRTQAGRHPADLSPRQPRQRLDPRGRDLLGQRSLHAGVQQPRHLQAGRGAEQHGLDRSGSRRQLGLERRPQDADLQTAAGRQVARRQAVHLGRRQMHLRHADGQVAAEVPPEPAQGLVRARQRRHHQRRLRGRVQPEAAAAGAAGAARLRLYADLSLPCIARGNAHPSDRHRPVQVRRVQGQRIDQARPAIRITGRRACRISTASSSPSSRTARPPFWRSSPASST